MKLLSWNVNGLRASLKKGFLDTLDQLQPDILGIQEIKAQREQLDASVLQHPVYETHFFPAERKGYSGVGLFTKPTPKDVRFGTGVPEFDQEGRVIRAEYDQFVLYNIYFPNGGMGEHRLVYKYAFYDHMLEEFSKDRDAGRHVIITGDYNVAHEPIDLARPKENETVSGFLPEERAWFTRLMQAGFVDTYRALHPEKVEYSWWNMRTRARERNVGWRIDYFVVNEACLPYVKDAFILMDVLGSDHCPVGITLEF